MCNSLIRNLSLMLLVFAASCGEAPEYRFGENITGLRFELFDENEGIHPNDITLTNPRNPFRTSVSRRSPLP